MHQPQAADHSSQITNKTPKYKFGLAVMRCQPYHLGHERLVNTMIGACEDIIIVLGTGQEWGTKKNPLNLEERKELILNIHPDIKVLGVPDLGHPELWAEYVFKLVEEYCGKVPDAYFAGSQFDTICFEGQIDHIININREDKNYPYITGSRIRDLLANQDENWKTYTNPKNHKLIKEKLHGKKFK